MNKVWIGLIVAIGALLRFWALGGGLPHRIGADEPEVMQRVLIMLRTGDYNPHFFDYPALYLYVQLVVATLRFMTGALLGYWTSLSQPQMLDFFVWGRAVTALLGAATVVIVYQVGLRWGTRQALLAAGLMAVMPLHVRESHFILTDVPATFFVTLAFLLALRASERPAAGAFALAGAAAGVAAAIKYPGALSLMLPLIALFLTIETRGARVRLALITVGASGAGFLIGAPYTLIDLPGFLNGYGHLLMSYQGPPPPEPIWVTYLKHLRNSAGWAGFIAMIVGLGISLARIWEGHGRARWVMLAAFPLVYLWFISGQTLVYGRYLLPMVPFACVLAANAVVPFAGRLRHLTVPRQVTTAVVVILTAVITLPPAFSSVRFAKNHGLRGTESYAHDWMIMNIPAGSSIVAESTDVNVRHMPFRFEYIRRISDRRYEDYVAKDVDYLLASSQRYGVYLANPAADPVEFEKYQRLFAMTEEVARFTPGDNRPGSELRVLKVKRQGIKP